MTYTPKTWAPGVAGNTLIRASDLNHMEQGIADNSSSLDDVKVKDQDQDSSLTDLSAQIAALADRVNKLEAAQQS